MVKDNRALRVEKSKDGISLEGLMKVSDGPKLYAVKKVGDNPKVEEPSDDADMVEKYQVVATSVFGRVYEHDSKNGVIRIKFFDPNYKFTEASTDVNPGYGKLVGKTVEAIMGYLGGFDRTLSLYTFDRKLRDNNQHGALIGGCYQDLGYVLDKK